MNAKKILNQIVEFLTTSPFEEEEEQQEEFTELEQMKVIKLFRKQKDYYITRCINDFERLADELARRDVQELLKNKDRVNELYTKMVAIR